MNNGGHPGVNVFTVVITRVNATSFKRKINKAMHMSFRFRKSISDQMCLLKEMSWWFLFLFCFKRNKGHLGTSRVSHSVMPNPATPWTIVHQVPLSMGFSEQEYWRGLPYPSPGNLTTPGAKQGSPALQDSLPSRLSGGAVVLWSRGWAAEPPNLCFNPTSITHWWYNLWVPWLLCASGTSTVNQGDNM